MLSIQHSSNPAWNTQLLKLLPGDHAEDSEKAALAVRAIFATGMRWADHHGIDHKRPSSDYYADQYIRTANEGRAIIPRFMRTYCAFLNNLAVQEGKVWEKPKKAAPAPQPVLAAAAA